jgi:hypothetical protein
MVMIGAYNEIKQDEVTYQYRQHWYFMLLNAWKSMPLVLVSPEDLMACSAHVYFLKNRLGCNSDDKLNRSDTLMGECTFPDGGDDKDEASVPFFRPSIEESDA